MLQINFIHHGDVQKILADKINRPKVEKALDKGAFLVEGDAKRLVRVDTGRLKNSVDTIRRPLERSIGSSVQYAAAQEYGRVDLPRYGYTPYLRPALRKNKQSINRLIAEALE